MAYNTTQRYKEVIYSGGAKHRLNIAFNGVSLEDADRYCEKITRKPRIIPDDGNKRFSLDNFVSQEIEIIFHKIDPSILQDPVSISIGTLVDEETDTYEDVPLGIFNIQDEPISDKDKITLKLRDNAVLFDFGYNAKPLMDENDGTATKMQILQDICNQANVLNTVEHFTGEDDEVGSYDNTITARRYIAYLAEQSGNIATINRDGELVFIDINDLETIKIPLSIVEKYEIGDRYSIERVAYEDAIRKFETSDDETLDTLYINGANPYISTQEQIDNILTKVNQFEIDSLTTGKIIGDPAIDPYDLIEIYGYYDENNQFVDDDETIVATTLATYTETYSGVITHQYDTQIGKEERTENVTLQGEATFQKYAKTNIDNLNNNITMIVAEQNETNQRLSQTIQDVNSIQNMFQITGGNNMIKDSQLLLGDEGRWEKADATVDSLFPNSNLQPSSSKYPIEHFYGTPSYIGGYDASLIGKTVSIAKIGISNGKMTTTQTNITGLIVDNMYTLSYKITNEADTTTTIKLSGNNNIIYKQVYENEMVMQEQVFSFVATTSTYILEIQSTSNEGNYCYVYDLMLNKGDVQTWEPASGEIVSTVLKLSQLGLQIYSTGSDIATLMTSQGFQIRRFQNGEMFEVITEFTSEGLETKKAKMLELLISNFEFKEVNYQGYDTLVLYKKESD